MWTSLRHKCQYYTVQCFLFIYSFIHFSLRTHISISPFPVWWSYIVAFRAHHRLLNTLHPPCPLPCHHHPLFALLWKPFYLLCSLKFNQSKMKMVKKKRTENAKKRKMPKKMKMPKKSWVWWHSLVVTNCALYFKGQINFSSHFFTSQRLLSHSRFDNSLWHFSGVPFPHNILGMFSLAKFFSILWYIHFLVQYLRVIMKWKMRNSHVCRIVCNKIVCAIIVPTAAAAIFVLLLCAFILHLYYTSIILILIYSFPLSSSWGFMVTHTQIILSQIIIN